MVPITWNPPYQTMVPGGILRRREAGDFSLPSNRFAGEAERLIFPWSEFHGNMAWETIEKKRDLA